MGRLDAIRTAERPAMHGRAMLSGPSGAGKTWTALSMARVLVDGDMSKVLLIDTERESALTYADVFPGFQHLPWTPPFDAGELTETYARLSSSFAVVITDSFSHFWRGQGGILDLADGKIGGWKTARPVQDALVQAVLAVPAHMLLCVRSKMDYLIEKEAGGKQQVTKLGIAPIQDETLVYEMNIALDIDLDHRITVTKSRTPAVPVGRMYPAGLEGKAAKDYAEWLAGGIPPAGREHVEAIVARFADIADAERRKSVKGEFVQLFGMPHSLTAEKMPDAQAWLETQFGSDPDDTAAAVVDPKDDFDVEKVGTATGVPLTGIDVQPGEVGELRADPPADGTSTFVERLQALPQDLAESVRSGEDALRQKVTPKSPEHIQGATKLLEEAEKKQNKRAQQVVLTINAGTEVAWHRPATDDERHQLLLTFTGGAVASAKKVTAPMLTAIKATVRDWQNGNISVEQTLSGEYVIREHEVAS